MKETLKKKRIGYALREDQMLQLIASEKDPRWQFNFQLLAVYGLRPEELRFLVIKDGVRGKELWTTYEKSMGGTKGQKTEPRKLAPCTRISRRRTSGFPMISIVQSLKVWPCFIAIKLSGLKFLSVKTFFSRCDGTSGGSSVRFKKVPQCMPTENLL